MVSTLRLLEHGQQMDGQLLWQPLLLRDPEYLCTFADKTEETLRRVDQRENHRWLPHAAMILLYALLSAIISEPNLAWASSEAEERIPPWGEGKSRAQDLTIELVTFGPGDDLITWFGHTAIVVRDRRLRSSLLYNYGIFSLDANLFTQFARGRLLFEVNASPVNRTIDRYQRANRDVRVQELSLSPAGRLKAAQYLADNVRPENRHYLYHHFNANCATRARDVLDLALDGQLRQYAEARPGEMSFRDQVRRYSYASPVMDFFFSFLMGSDNDRPTTLWEDMFLPEELERVVGQFHYTNEQGREVKLARESRQIVHAEGRAPTPDAPLTRWPWTLLIGLVVGGCILLIGRFSQQSERTPLRVLFGVTNALPGLVLGLPGLLLTLMCLFTEHEFTYWNQSLLLVNPLTLAALPLGLAHAFGSTRALPWLAHLWKILGAAALMALVLIPVGLIYPPLYQDLSLLMTLVLPINLALAVATHLYAQRQCAPHPPQPQTV